MLQPKDMEMKAKRVIMLTPGPYASIRMVHRSLQGMRSGQIMDVMSKMSAHPRGSLDYLGQFKIVPLTRVRQGRKEAGIFYKCLPEEISNLSLEKLDIGLEEYSTVFYEMFKYDRMPQPEYFIAVAEHSPYHSAFQPLADSSSAAVGVESMDTSTALYPDRIGEESIDTSRDASPLPFRIGEVYSTRIKQEQLTDEEEYGKPVLAAGQEILDHSAQGEDPVSSPQSRHREIMPDPDHTPSQGDWGACSPDTQSPVPNPPVFPDRASSLPVFPGPGIIPPSDLTLPGSAWSDPNNPQPGSDWQDHGDRATNSALNIPVFPEPLNSLKR